MTQVAIKSKVSTSSVCKPQFLGLNFTKFLLITALTVIFEYKCPHKRFGKVNCTEGYLNLLIWTVKIPVLRKCGCNSIVFFTVQYKFERNKVKKSPGYMLKV